MARRDKDDSLAAQIVRARVLSEFDQTERYFYPDGVIDDLIHGRSIIKALGEAQTVPGNSDGLSMDPLIDFIMAKAKKVFAIAIRIGIPAQELRVAMQLLRNAGISDESLPIDQGSLPEEWDLLRTIDFCTQQWSFIAPVFSRRKFTYDLEPQAILPFIKRVSKCDPGASGRVWQLQIDKSHLVDEDDAKFRCPGTVAVKEIQPNEEDRKHIVDMWGQEARALQKMNLLHQPHIVKFHTSFRRGDPGRQDHYLMFEWADGGNLRDLWRTFDRPALSRELVKATVRQILGLAKAIDKAHYPETGPNFRHGDLKPENILWFTGKEMGTLKIGDWGTAKQHFHVTEMRNTRTKTAWGTRTYEPPEEVCDQSTNLRIPGQYGSKRSRLYDMWAFGCITLEFLIWLMYGREELKRFNQGIIIDDANNTRFYLTKLDDNGNPKARVHDVAAKWMEHMANDPICKSGSTALGSLLEIVQNRLLVVKLPERLGTTMRPSENIMPEDNDTMNIDSPNSELPASDPDVNTSIPAITFDEAESPANAADVAGNVRVPTNSSIYWRKLKSAVVQGLSAGNTERTVRYPTALSDEMLALIAESIMISGFFSPSTHFHELVADEAILGPQGGMFLSFYDPLMLHDYGTNSWNKISMTYQLKSNSKAKSCDLCRLIWKACSKSGATRDSTVTVTRKHSSIRINDEGRPALSIYRSLDANSEIHFDIIRQWLEHCDRSHQDCCPATSLSAENSLASSASLTHLRNLPKRVIDVGKPGGAKVYLRETSPKDNGEWIALSHQWGNGQLFRTLPENRKSYIDDGIAFAELPKTFRDAVEVTRALNRPFLWIDSICIVQGPKGDFKEEAKRMEDVYSGAYCVLAAARSPGHYAGFLQTRKQRPTVTLQQDKGSAAFYICEAIDDFSEHVLESSLNKRGWVLQEHALARRTVYFTEHQTYFECGDGIRCETMTKMQNELATFMGDPNFPRIIMRAGQGEKILRYQDLYKRYSSLGLSDSSDRPMAIDSLQARVLNVLGARGGFGVLDEEHQDSEGHIRGRGLLRRSLLWRRADKTPDMSPITFLPHHGITHVPSWSWMKYTGSIDYISPPFGGVYWEPLESPWSSGEEVRDALVAEARDYDVSTAIEDGDGEIIFDRTSKKPPPSTKCIVLGRKMGTVNMKDSRRTHYLLVIEPTKDRDQDGRQIYQRVGVGYLPGKCIKSKVVPVSVR
ncbi:hypothetical protein J7T55_009779 [Diaporthe amygdali]|uniref:uncharacterized protein n=1 Tax=Phomopsis amygdali TaxID=1214568 RepID=UPI0022FE3824|nr:uncharacterized protein J7T55_009779 [Diaporthe amygdali]KAJ0116629.1 hypothetical protein J7T55_009779 [Diaporthe amygdali]